MRISREDSADLDFVLECLFTGAISLAELRQWADHAIAALPEPPLWLFDLQDFDGFAGQVYQLIGFHPHGSDADPRAIAGIAWQRGRTVDISVNPRAKSLAALARQPEIAARFNMTFPFLEPVAAPPPA